MSRIELRDMFHLLHVLEYTSKKKNLSLKILNAFATDKEEEKQLKKRWGK